MSEPRRNLLLRIPILLWRLVDGSRRVVVNLIFVALVLLLIAAVSARPTVPKKSALVLSPRGVLVEQLSGSAVDRALARLEGREVAETLLRDLLDALATAKGDDRIQAVLLDLGDLDGAGLSKLRDLKVALADFKTSGKRVVARADAYSQAAYYLAAQADEVHLHPMGMVLLQGYGIWQPYFKEGLDKFGIDAHVFRVGEYKSAAEPFLRNDLSPEARESYLDVLSDLWGAWLADVAAARKLKAEDITRALDELNLRLAAAGGDMAKLALDARLVDRLSNADEVRERMIALVGEEAATHSFRQIGVADYLKARRVGREAAPPSGAAVGVVVAKGDILDGLQPPGAIGGESTAALIRRARQDDEVKAIVLRVDSGGGSAFASEVIRRELELARAGGKPVVVSMGSVAASGGYWISTSADEIWASPETVTGSIGIYGVFPTFQKPLAKYLGIRVDGVGTTWLSGAVRPDRELAPAAAEALQRMLERGYEEFLERVGKARKMNRDQVDRIARGRIWSGEEAQRLGLVDHLGGLPQAIAAAARRGGLAGEPRVRFIERELEWSQKLAAELLDSAAVRSLRQPTSARGFAPRLRLQPLREQLEALGRWNDPQGLYAHCLCAIDG